MLDFFQHKVIRLGYCSIFIFYFYNSYKVCQYNNKQKAAHKNVTFYDGVGVIVIIIKFNNPPCSHHARPG